MLNQIQEKPCRECRWNSSDLKALFINCTVEKSPARSHTDGLVRVAQASMGGPSNEEG